jgi:hypothetical protein
MVVACGPQVVLEDDTGHATASSTGPVVTTTPTTGPTTITTVGTDPGDPSTSGVGSDDGTSTGPVFPEQCSTIDQDCPRGWKCMPYANDGGGAWNDTICVPIAEDPSGVGEPCTVVGSGTSGEDDCDGSSMCWDVDPETNLGTCVPFCSGTVEDPVCADPCVPCAVANEGVITLCLGTCDPLMQDCERGGACYLLYGGFVCVPDVGRGPGIGEPCEFPNVCPSGSTCTSAEAVPGCMGAVGCCTPFCAVGGADPCPGLLPGTTCTAFEAGEGPPAGCTSEPIGVCAQG